MTYNIRHGAPIHKPDDDIQLEQLAKVIKSENPDIVALQEVDSVTKRAPLDEARELGELTGMHYAYFKAIDYQGGKYGVGILSRYPILKKQQQQLALPDPSGEPRTVGVITIEPVKGVKINFATTHLDLKKENRLAQIKQLITLSEDSPHPLLVAGDFNAQPNSEEIKALKKEFTFTCTNDCPLTFPSDTPRITLDYVILNPEAAKLIQPVGYKAIENIPASDHLPFVAGLRLKKTD